MSAVAPQTSLGVAARARATEDVVVGQDIVRHRLTSRAIHWTVASLFFLSLLSGLPIWTPIFGWMAALFGGLSVCRWLHPWAGVLFVTSSLVMFFHWRRDMRLRPSDREWLRPKKIVQYMKHEGDGPEVGKYNGGQKLFFFATALGALGLVLTGVVLWFPLSFPPLLRAASILLHDLTLILLRRRHRVSHLPGHGGPAGDVRRDDPWDRHQGMGA